MLRMTSIQAPNQDFIISGTAEYLSRRLGMAVDFVGERPWQERERLLDEGQIELGWICGLPYVVKTADPCWPLELLAAPVMAGARYKGRPVYFSDVIVRRGSGITDFSGLRGRSWAFNEPNSHSGYGITRFELARRGETGAYFGEVIEAGSHERALQLVLDGEIDAAAIDSTVLELEIKKRPALFLELRVIDVWGPSPIPPIVIRKDLPIELKQAIRDELLAMNLDPLGSGLLAEGLVSKIVGVTDGDYDLIREMGKIGQSAKLESTVSKHSG